MYLYHWPEHNNFAYSDQPPTDTDKYLMEEGLLSVLVFDMEAEKVFTYLTNSTLIEIHRAEIQQVCEGTGPVHTIRANEE